MAKEYIERKPILKFIEDGLNNPDKSNAFGHDAIEIMTEVQYAPTADVVEVFRPDEDVLAEFENDYKDFKKIKTHLAQIIVEGKVEKPYYSILWWDEESKEYNIGYSSYCLDYVRKWLELVFDVVDTADVVEVVRCKDCKFWNCYGDEEKHKGECIELELDCCMYEDDFCSYGKRRDSDG